MHENGLHFTGIIVRGDHGFVSLCEELDVASQGETVEESKQMLLEAVTLYLESAVENNLPYLRPIPPDENPRFTDLASVVEVFPVRVELAVHAHA